MKSILIVDDEVDSLEMLQLLLQMEGYRVLTARDGRECMSRLAAERPDLLVLDLMMPIMSGWEVLEELEKRPDLRSIPVILSSAADCEEVAARYGHATLRKPIVLKELRALVRRVLDQA